ncbi:MAG: cation:proton antiporter [Steroidobacteraceae bacterium]
MLYLGAGVAAGVSAARAGLMPPLELDQARTAQVLIEAGLIVGLFCAGLKLTAPLDLAHWRLPLRLAAITLPVTAALTAGAARVLLGLPIEEAVVLGVILAPTDPVLAGCLEHPNVESRGTPRFVLLAEGALTSSLALPLLMFAIGFAGERDLGPLAARWLALDVVWAVAGGALLGALIGTLAARALSHLDGRAETQWLAVLFAASALAATYGAACIVQVNGLAAALAAGMAFSRGGLALRGGRVGWAGGSRPNRLAQQLAAGADRIEHSIELAACLLIGLLLAGSMAHPALVLFALLMLVAVRPLAAGLGIGAALPRVRLAPGERRGAAERLDTSGERRTLAWFGVRGIASLYCLSLVIDGPAVGNGGDLAAITLVVLATSIALHGLTAVPLGKRPARVQGSR